MPLHNQDDPESVKLLVNAGADVNVRDHNRFTPLDFLRSNSEIVRILFAHGAKETNNEIRNSLNLDKREYFDEAKAEGLKDLKGREQDCRGL